ncbi:MAG: hypothetical protein ABI321_20205 [Polyangia bacterium]
MSTWQAVATVPDAGTAELLREVLTEGGVEDVQVRSTTGIPYMPRAQGLQYEVRVLVADIDRAQLVLRDYEEVIAPAAESEAARSVTSDDHAAPSHARGRWVLWVAAATLLAIFLPRLFLFVTKGS